MEPMESKLCFIPYLAMLKVIFKKGEGQEMAKSILFTNLY